MQWCAEQGCGVLVPSGRCPKHVDRSHSVKGTARQRGYSSRWDRLAHAFRKQYPLCGMRPHNMEPVMSRCHEHGIHTVATCVDHVVPHRGDLHLMWDEDNWQSLCSACHMIKTAKGQ